MRYALLLITILMTACNKPNPNPELIDPIYMDLTAQENENESFILAEKSKLEENLAALETVTPQSGRLKFVNKRIWEARASLEKLNQRRLYLKVRKESRKRAAKMEYLSAFTKGEPWPNPVDTQKYKTQRKLESASRHWNSKRRIEELASRKK